MEFSNEFIEENQLTPEQVSAVSEIVTKQFNEEMGKEVHENVENSLGKIYESVKTITGIEREHGEKYADALKRASGLYFEGQKNTLERKQQELEEKLKNVKGDEALKAQLTEVNEQLSKYKERAALADEWEKEDYKGKYEKANEQLSTLEKRIAYKEVIPAKPDNVNKYEWDAKWKEWQKEVEQNNKLVFDEDGNAWAVDKENEFKKTKLSDLAKQNETLQELLKAREQKGLGSGQQKVTIEGLPFKIPENATSQERTKAIREYLAGQNISKTSAEYSKKFAEYNAKILGLEKKQA